MAGSESERGVYRVVFGPRMWRQGSFSRLPPMPPCSRGLFLYLLTGDLTGPLPGVIEAGRGALIDRLGAEWAVGNGIAAPGHPNSSQPFGEPFDKAFAELLRAGMVKADWNRCLVWLPEAVKYNRPANPNVVLKWGKCFNRLPDCALKVEVYQALKQLIEPLGKGFAKGFAKGFVEPLAQPLGEPLTESLNHCETCDSVIQQDGETPPSTASPSFPPLSCGKAETPPGTKHELPTQTISGAPILTQYRWQEGSTVCLICFEWGVAKPRRHGFGDVLCPPHRDRFRAWHWGMAVPEREGCDAETTQGVGQT